MLYWLGAMITGFTADKIYNVLPDSKRCVQHPCLYLYYLIDNHQHYFTSNTKIIFSEEHHLHTNMIIQNISNFSLLATFYGEIICLPQSFIYFHNVVNITINNIAFLECGNSLKNDSQWLYWASILYVHDVYISNPVGYGIIAYNMLGHNILENVYVDMGRQKSFSNSCLYTCSYGLHMSFFDSNVVQMDQNVTLIITNINVDLTLKLPDNSKTLCDTCCGKNYYEKFRAIFEVFLKQHHYPVLIAIKNSKFSHLIGNVMMIDVESLANNDIFFSDCDFTHMNNYEQKGKTSLDPKEYYSQHVATQCLL